MKPGDTITKVEFIFATKEAEELEGGSSPLNLDKDADLWPMVQYRLQQCLPDTKIKLEYQRGTNRREVEVSPIQSTEWNAAERGLVFTAASEVHRVSRLTEAFALGWRETKEGIGQVVFVLKKLVTGQFSPKNLGGPFTILYAAGSEASEGFPRLLLFLTMLSANLAVLNFLPIPVLDGGHAVFLLYEGIFRKPPNDRVAFGLTITGLCLILGLMLFVLGMDIKRFYSWIL
jgi:regulator of sigma E protease